MSRNYPTPVKCDTQVDSVVRSIVSESIMKETLEIQVPSRKNSRSPMTACPKSTSVYIFWWLWDLGFILRLKHLDR